MVRRLCDNVKSEASGHDDKDPLQQLKDFWLVTNADRLSDGGLVEDMDERFHLTLVVAAGNPEMARVHLEVTERIRIIRRLDFTRADRVEETYNEHAQILRAILERRADQAVLLLSAHIEASKAEVRKITLHRLYAARNTDRD